MEISKLQSVCLDKASEDRLLYLMTGPRLAAFCDQRLCVAHFGEFMRVSLPMNEALPSFPGFILSLGTQRAKKVVNNVSSLCTETLRGAG